MGCSEPTETWSPAKLALADLVVALSACRIRALAARAATIRTASLLYALIDPKRRNQPTAAQLREAARIAREVARDVIIAAKAADCAADQLEQRPRPASVRVSSHQNSHRT